MCLPFIRKVLDQVQDVQRHNQQLSNRKHTRPMLLRHESKKALTDQCMSVDTEAMHKYSPPLKTMTWNTATSVQPTLQQHSTQHAVKEQIHMDQ